MGKFQRNGVKFAKVSAGYRSPYNRVGVIALQSRKGKGSSSTTVKGPVGNRQEVNYVDTTVSSTALSTAGTIALLNGITEGDVNTNRNGRKCVMKSVQIHGTLNASGGTNVDEPRAVLIWDNAPNGVLPAITDIFTADNVYAFPKIDNSARFTILKDMHGGGIFGVAPTNSPTFMSLECYRKLNDATRFIGSDNTIASIQNGAIYMVCWGTAASINSSDVSYRARVRFIEK